MGMTCTLHRVASTDIELLKNDNAMVRRLLYGDEENWIVTRPKGLLGFLLRFTPLSIESTTRREPLSDEAAGRIKEVECDLEGVWQGLHFLFTGTAWEGDEPACYLVRGGEPVGGDDFDDPPRLLRPETVQGFGRFLAGLSDDELRHRYDPALMTELKISPYGLSADRSAPDEQLSLLLESFNDLRTFTYRAVTAGDGMIVHLG